jgi:hypothetical protein
MDEATVAAAAVVRRQRRRRRSVNVADSSTRRPCASTITARDFTADRSASCAASANIDAPSAGGVDDRFVDID